jgi:hypothetical protein
VKNPIHTSQGQRRSNYMNVPGNGHDPEDDGGGKWGPIRYAIAERGTTVRLLTVLRALAVPTCPAVWLVRR